MRGIENWLPFALVAVIWLGEIKTFRRRPGAAARDRGSYRFVTAVFTIGYGAAFAVRGYPPRLGAWALAAGAASCLAGTAFRVWAVAVLGQYFTRTVQVSVDQQIVDAGPYRLIRHPSYTGAIASALGVALSLRGVWSLASIAAAVSLGLGYRVAVEERALCEALGEPYRAYMRRTKRFIPFIF